MDEVPAGGDPSQQEHARATRNSHQIGNSLQERLEANLGGDAAVPGLASIGQAEAWDARATSLARRLESRGVCADQLFVVLDAVLPTGWDSEAGITLSNEESGRYLRELGVVGSATAAILRMRRMAQADASLAGVLRAAAMSSACQHACRRLANFPYGTCCQACPRPRHTDQCSERQRLFGAAQSTTGVGGTSHATVDFHGGQQPPSASSNSGARIRARSRSASRAALEQGYMDGWELIGSENSCISGLEDCRQANLCSDGP